MVKTKILITGSGGCLGSNLIRILLKDYGLSYQVASLDYCLSKSNLNTVLSNQHSFYPGNVSDAHLVNTIFQLEKPNIVIHLIPYTGVFEIQTACQEHGSKLILVNSTQVPDAINIKSSFHFGPKQNITKVVPTFINSINNSTPVYLNESLLADWIHVQDLCRAIIKIIKTDTITDYEISANNIISYRDLFLKMCDISGKGRDLLNIETDPIDDNFIFQKLDNSKIRQLGWQPLFKLENGLAHTIDWYNKNPWFLRNK